MLLIDTPENISSNKYLLKDYLELHEGQRIIKEIWCSVEIFYT